MVSAKGIEVILQTRLNNKWYGCEEFESPETLGESKNSGTRRTTVVECDTGLFRFHITLLGGDFEWLDTANGLQISLTFDEGDPIKKYEIAVLRPGAGVLQDLGLETLKATTDAEDLSHYLETICMPSSTEDLSSAWLNASFEFGRYSKDAKNPDKNAPASTSKGQLKIDIVQCIIERNTRRNCCIALVPKLDLKWRSLPPASNVTLKPELRFDPSQICSPSRRYKCKPVRDDHHVSFTFLYREVGHYERIEEEDIDVVKDESASLLKPDRAPSKKTAPIQTPDSGSRSLHPATAGRPSVAQKHSTESTDDIIPASEIERIPSPHTDVLAPSAIHYEAAGGQFSDAGELSSLLDTITKIRPKIEKMGRKGDEAERAVLLKQLEVAASDTASAQSALESAQHRLDSCRSREEKLRSREEKIAKRLQNISQPDGESEDEEKENREEARKALQKLLDGQLQRLETRKRRVSQWSTASSSPNRETWRTRRGS